jgi:hypothetical protein
MHSNLLRSWQHSHAFLGRQHRRHERRIWLVVALTAAMMIAEIAVGTIYGSMALVADGWHMSTHAATLAIAALAYSFARRSIDDAASSPMCGQISNTADTLRACEVITNWTRAAARHPQAVISPGRSTRCRQRRSGSRDRGNPSISPTNSSAHDNRGECMLRTSETIFLSHLDMPRSSSGRRARSRHVPA